MNNKYERSLISVLVVLFVFSAFMINSYRERVASVERVQNMHDLYVAQAHNLLASTDTEAKSVAVYDFTLNEKLYSKHDQMVLPLASLTKIISVPMALDKAPTSIVISPEAIKAPGDDQLVPGDVWEKYALAKFALVLSSNDATWALIEDQLDLLRDMNDKVVRLGAANTYFVNHTGLDINPNQAGAFGTAEDINILANYAFQAHPDLWQATIHPYVRVASKTRNYEIQNTNLIVGELPNVLLSKTGYTNLAGGNLTVMFNNKIGHRIGVTLLGSSYHGRFDDMAKIVGVLYNLEYGI